MRVQFIIVIKFIASGYEMENRQLRYFLAVAQELHFGRAADRLQITQPALSKQITAMEQELGVQLLFRTKRSVQLTHAGKVLFDQAQQLLLQTEVAIQLTQRTARGEIGQLTLGFTETATHTVLPHWIRRFHQDYPQVEIVMEEMNTETQVKALNEGEIDLAFLHPPIDERGLQVHPILEEEFMAVLPLHHPLLRYERLPLETFAGEPLIIHPRSEGPALYDDFLQICHAAGFHPQIRQESISLQTRICWVASGLGITFTSASLTALVGQEVACRPLLNCPITLGFAAAWRQSAVNPALTAFLRSLELTPTLDPAL